MPKNDWKESLEKSDWREPLKKKKEIKRQVSAEIQTPVIALEKTTLQKAYEYSVKKGYGCILEKGVLMFPYSDNNDAIVKDLVSKFGYEKKEETGGVMKSVKRLPFSYGFANIKKDFAKAEEPEVFEETEGIEMDEI